MKRRQVCWSHLMQRLVDFQQRDGPAEEIGAELVELANLVFHYWRAWQTRALSREESWTYIDAVRKRTRSCLERAVAAEIPEGSCADMLAHFEAMWTFVKTPGVEPTNNHAERELRPLVM